MNEEDNIENFPHDHLAPEPEAQAHEHAAPADNDAGRIAELEAEVARMKDHLLRAMAETENTRKRAQRDREDAGKYAIANFARDLLDFGDNFHRALEAIPAELKTGDERVASVIAGIEVMETTLLKTFDKHGIVKIIPLDLPFDPNFHEVLFEAPGTGKPGGTVIQVVEPGYVIKDRLLRPARVGIAKDDGAGTSPGSRIDQQA